MLVKTNDNFINTGIIRTIDELGRIVLPSSLRKDFGIKERDKIQIYLMQDFIVLKKCCDNNKKEIGVYRGVDELGRLVIPMEIRERLGLTISVSMEIYIKDNYILLKKYEPYCSFCKCGRRLIKYKTKLICTSCINNLYKKIKSK